MDDQKAQLEASYGRVMFFAHLIEDLVAQHLFECGWYEVNGCLKRTQKRVGELNHRTRINELGKIYGADTDPNINRIIEGLHSLRIIRNQLTHALIDEVGTDFTKEEGLDQILGMLAKVEKHMRSHLGFLESIHEQLLKHALENCIDQLMEREDGPFEANVATSRIQKELEAIEANWDRAKE
ncbi:MAG: hypothetical protein ACPGAP_02310 [Akkermansiaceae bacterium]